MWKSCLASSTMIMILQLVLIFKQNHNKWYIFGWVMSVLFFAILLTIVIVRSGNDD